MQVGELKRRVTVVMDSIDTATWFRDRLRAVRSELTTLNEQVAELEIKITNSFAGTATRAELATAGGDITATRTEFGTLRTTVEQGFADILDRLAPKP
jgi:hypothetical protein